MDFRPGMIQRFPGNVPLPFYMTYPGYLRPEQESAILRDLEYLQQTSPGEVKRYQRKVAEILDKMDYEGSMIYDEYPDGYTIRRLARTVTDMLRKEEEKTRMDKADNRDNTVGMNDADKMDKMDEIGGKEPSANPEKWIWVENIIQVLIVNEIYKRRHGGRRYFGGLPNNFR